MGSGLSMTSVNKIKELAEAKEYSVAVEILDSQNLEASYNPQFLRICGEVYENVGRPRDARNMYVKAHIMGPESGRIVFSLIRFYLKQGYFKLAELYREQYIKSVRGAEQEVKNLDYVMEKAKGASLQELRDYLDPYYTHELDETWSFELFLLYRMMGLDTEMLASDYMATFRKSRSRELMKDVLDGRVTAEELFYIYAKEEKNDDDPRDAEIRALEMEQLKQDRLRLHPEEDAELVEDEKENVDDEGEAEILETPDPETKFKSFLKRKFRKKEKEESEEGSEEEKDETPKEEAETSETEEDKEEEGEAAPAEVEGPAEENTEPDEEKEEKRGSWVKNLAGTIGDRVRNNKEEMQEITPDTAGLLTVDFDDGFAAESDTITDLAPPPETSYENPFDIINAYKLAGKDKGTEPISFSLKKNEVFDDAEPEESKKTEPVEMNEPEPVDMSEPESQAIVGKPETVPEEELESEWEEPETTAEPEVAEESVPEPLEEEPEEELEPEWEESEATEESEVAEESVPEPVAEEPEEEPEPEWEEPEATEESEGAEESEPEPAAEEPEEETEPEWEKPEATEESEEAEESEPEPAVEEPEEETEPEWEKSEATEESEQAEESVPEPAAGEPEEETEPEWEKPEATEESKEAEESVPEVAESEEEPEEEEKSEAGEASESDGMKEEPKEEAEAENTSESTGISSKLDEGLLEEERLQREAEALLASLGIKL